MVRIFLFIFILLTFNTSHVLAGKTEGELCDLDKISITLKATDRSIDEIFDDIQKQAQYAILLDDTEILNKTKSIEFTNTPLNQSLKRLLGVRNYSIICSDNEKTLTIVLLDNKKAPSSTFVNASQTNPRYGSGSTPMTIGPKASLTHLTDSEREEMEELYDLLEQEQELKNSSQTSSGKMPPVLDQSPPSFSHLPPEERREQEELYQMLQEEKAYKDSPSSAVQTNTRSTNQLSPNYDKLTEEEIKEMEALQDLLNQEQEIKEMNNINQ